MEKKYYREKKRRAPGPGRYRPSHSNSEKKRPSFHLVGKTTDKHYRRAPGPGTYFKNKHS